MLTYEYTAYILINAAVLLWGLGFYLAVFTGGKNPPAGLLAGLSDKIKALAPCEIKNLEKIEGLVKETSSANLIDSFDRYKADTKIMLKNRAAPEADGYFNIKSIFTTPSAGYYESLLLKIVIASAVVTSIIPIAYVTVFNRLGEDGSAFAVSAGLSLFCVAWAALVYIFVLSLIRRSETGQSVALEKFNASLQYALPTAGKESQIALILDSSETVKESFARSADLIVAKINNFAVETIAPAAALSFDRSISEHIAPVFASMDRTMAAVSSALLEKQEQGLALLADRFSDRLYSVIDEKMAVLSQNVVNITAALKEASDKMEDIVSKSETNLASDREVLASIKNLAENTAGVLRMSSENILSVSTNLNDAKTITEDMRKRTEQLISSVEGMAIQNAEIISGQNEQLTKFKTEMTNALETINSIFSENKAVFTENNARLGTVLTDMTAAVEKSYEQSVRLIDESLNTTGEMMVKYIDAGGSHIEKITTDTLARISGHEQSIKESLEENVKINAEALRKSMESNADTAEKLNRTIDSLANAGSEQYEKAAKAAASLLENIVTEINKAMDGVGREIAESISGAAGENGEILGRLITQTEMLKAEYDVYFKRVEEQNRLNYDEMDFHMQNVIARFTQETDTIIKNLHETITGIMNFMDGNTAALTANMEEQSRSIGLYAKELALDVSSLSSSLKESVAEFSEHIHSGVVGTFDDFDKGLAEINKRLANTIESIRDAIDNLPQAFKSLKTEDD